jgi:hypothetical protein
MAALRSVLLAVVLAAAALAGTASASTALGVPTGLHGFLLRADEPQATVFHRTPSFAWAPVAGATGYEFQISTSNTFRDNGLIFDTAGLTTPVAAPPLILPWSTGSPHSLYARVRATVTTATGATDVTPWSDGYGFDITPPPPPAPLATEPGLLRWTPIEGADSYQVWLIDVRTSDAPTGKKETVRTNVMDERELYTFHQGLTWTGSVRWRVRAVRSAAAGQPANGLPAVAYGAWSPVYDSTNPAVGGGPITLIHTVSDVISDGTATAPAHRLMPGFAWTGNLSLSGTAAELYRVYVFTDSQCLNLVYASATVGSPTYAPRPGGPLGLPADQAGLDAARGGYLRDDREPNGQMADGTPVTPQEQAAPATPTTTAPADAGPSGSTPPTGSAPPGSSSISAPAGVGAPVDLWDTNWPQSGYYWTVVPVAATASNTGGLVYRDLELPQDACASGRVMRFGIGSEPSLTRAQDPFATGLSATGRLISAASTRAFYGRPLVAWTPALGAQDYEVQWSKKVPGAKSYYPFKAEGTIMTTSTAAVLPLTPGAWYYRVRGFDHNLPTGVQQMSWSDPQQLVVTAPKFSVAPDPAKKFKVVGKSK